MKKLLLITLITTLFLMFATNSSAGLVTLEQIDAGEPGSFENPINIGDILDLYVIADVEMMFAGLNLNVNGPANIIAATGKNEAADFGWDPDVSDNPIISIENAELRLGTAETAFIFPTERIAKVTIQITGAGQIQITLSDSENRDYPNWDSMLRTADVDGSLTIYAAAPEPTTIAMLMAGLVFIKRKNNSKK